MNNKPMFAFKLIALLIAVTILNCPGTVLGRVVGPKFQADTQEEDSAEDRIQRVRSVMTKLKKQDYNNQLLLQIDSIQELIQLEDSQRKKLLVAAKAIAGKRTEKWAKLMDEYGIWQEAIEYLNTELEDIEKADEIDFSELPGGALQWLSEDEAMGIFESILSSDKLWTKAVNAVTNDEQKKILKEHVAKQNEESVAALVDYLSRTVGQKLVISQDNKEAFRMFVDREIRKRPIRSEVLSMNTEVMAVAMSRLAAADDEDLESILSNTQINRWRILMASYGPEGFMCIDDADFQFEEDVVDEDTGDEEEDQDEEKADDEENDNS